MIQDKAQSAGNGESFSRTATPYWIIRVAPHFERTEQQSFAVLRLLGGASREAVVCGVAPLGKDAPLPARRAWRFVCPLRATASRLAEPVIITLKEYQGSG